MLNGKRTQYTAVFDLQDYLARHCICVIVVLGKVLVSLRVFCVSSARHPSQEQIPQLPWRQTSRPHLDQKDSVLTVSRSVGGPVGQ